MNGHGTSNSETLSKQYSPSSPLKPSKNIRKFETRDGCGRRIEAIQQGEIEMQGLNAPPISEAKEQDQQQQQSAVKTKELNRKKERQREQRRREKENGGLKTPVADSYPSREEVERPHPDFEALKELSRLSAQPRPFTDFEFNTDLEPNTASHSLKPPVDNLTVTLMRPASPQIETIVTSRSPPHIKSAVGMIVALQSRTTHLKSQIAALEAQLSKTEKTLSTLLLNALSADIFKCKSRIEMLQEIIALALEHWSELFVVEHALKDVVDEEGVEMLEKEVEKAMVEFEELMGRYDEKHLELLIRAWPEAVEKTVAEIAGKVVRVEEKEQVGQWVLADGS